MSFADVFRDRLTQAERDAFDAWFDALENAAGSAIEKRDLADVRRNVMAEDIMPDIDIEAFVRALLSVTPNTANFKSVCSRFFFRGGSAAILADVTQFLRVAHATGLAFSFATAADAKSNIHAYLSAGVLKPHAMKKLKRNLASIGPTDCVFATFRERFDSRFPSLPLAQEAYRALGLVFPLRNSAPGIPAITFTYAKDVPEDPPGACIPTTADAGFYSVFMPQPTGSPHGWTRDLGASAPNTPGLPEIVHKNFPANLAHIDQIPG